MRIVTGWTGALYKAIRKVAAVGGRIELYAFYLPDQAVVMQGFGKMLGQDVVLAAGGPTEPVEFQMESLG